MKVKRILSAALVLCLVAALALAAGCNTDSGSGTTSSKPNPTASASVQDIYGEGLSEDVITALQSSGTITSYTMYQDQVNSSDWSDEFRQEMEFYKKYYGLTIKWKFQKYGDDLSKFLVDYSNGDAPDIIPLSYRRWPKAGNRQVVYNIDELKELGVVGLDHPELTRYEDVAARFRVNDKYYSPGIYYTTPAICAVNVDLFDKYKVKSPIEYYKEGNWNLDTYMQCCKELSRTDESGKIYGGVWRDHTYYLVANDARLVRWNDDYSKLVLTMKETRAIKALEIFQNAFVNGYSPDDNGGAAYFKKGTIGMYIHDANNYAQNCTDYTFKWDIIPAPLGADNVSGEIPGECSGNGVVTSTKNPQGCINYFIARSQWSSLYNNQPYGMYYVDSFKGVYSDEQVKMICGLADHIGLDLYWGVSNLSSTQFGVFWDPIKRGTGIKEVVDAAAPVFQQAIDEENQAKAESEKTNPR